jgi:hypothetical protein
MRIVHESLVEARLKRNQADALLSGLFCDMWSEVERWLNAVQMADGRARDGRRIRHG